MRGSEKNSELKGQMDTNSNRNLATWLRNHHRLSLGLYLSGLTALCYSITFLPQEGNPSSLITPTPGREIPLSSRNIDLSKEKVSTSPTPNRQNTGIHIESRTGFPTSTPIVAERPGTINRITPTPSHALPTYTDPVERARSKILQAPKGKN
jgi:hypothetical protein